MEKVRFAILGCGGISRVHAEAINMTDDAVLVACYDISEKRTAEFAGEFGIYACHDRDEFFDLDTDVIAVCTPSACHSSDAVEALTHGKNVILEKPMSLTSAEADTVICAAEKNGKITLFEVSKYVTAHDGESRQTPMVSGGSNDIVLFSF